LAEVPVNAVASSASTTTVIVRMVVLGKQTGDSMRLEREGVQHQGAGDDRAQGQSEYLGNPTFAHFNLPTQALATL
jgi:hypothetical protein